MSDLDFLLVFTLGAAFGAGLMGTFLCDRHAKKWEEFNRELKELRKGVDIDV